MLQIDHASISFGENILFSEFNMWLAKGETACISGESGRGKTSLLNAILGLLPLSCGTIRVNEVLLDRTTVDSIRKQIAFIPQELAIPTEWVKEMIALPFTLKCNKHTPFSEDLLFEYFEVLGLNKKLYQKRVCEISGGQRQRIMLAVAALLNKPLIVIDEPTSALDPHSTDKVLLFLRHEAEKGKAVLVVSHDEIIGEGCDQFIRL